MLFTFATRIVMQSFEGNASGFACNAISEQNLSFKVFSGETPDSLIDARDSFCFF